MIWGGMILNTFATIMPQPKEFKFTIDKISNMELHIYKG